MQQKPVHQIQNFYEALKEYQIESRKAVGWIHIFPQKLNNLEEPLVSPIKYHPKPADELKVRFEKVKRNINFFMKKR